MNLISRVLSPHGVAYISYNANPGNYSSLRLRDFALLHIDVMRAANPGCFESPDEQVRETRRLLQLLSENIPPGASPPVGDLFWEASLYMVGPKLGGPKLCSRNLTTN